MSSRALKALASGLGVVALTATVLVQPWEGKENHAYRDIVNVLTICYGETQGVKPGDYKTDAQCEQMVIDRLEKDYYQPLLKCTPGYLKAPKGLQASLLSASYNVGVRALCTSTAVKLTARKRYEEACHAVTRFNKAGGKVIRGLKLRREYGDKTRIGELELCLASLK